MYKHSKKVDANKIEMLTHNFLPFVCIKKVICCSHNTKIMTDLHFNLSTHGKACDIIYVKFYSHLHENIHNFFYSQQHHTSG
jgi:hypothetical protein